MTAPNNNEDHGEITVSAAGITGRAKGYRLMDLVCLATLVLTTYITVAIADHKYDVRTGDVLLVEQVKESHKMTVRAVENSNQTVVQALKENSEATRDTNRALRELICITTLPLDRRVNQQEFCKRVSHER